MGPGGGSAAGTRPLGLGKPCSWDSMEMGAEGVPRNRRGRSLGGGRWLRSEDGQGTIVLEERGCVPSLNLPWTAKRRR